MIMEHTHDGYCDMPSTLGNLTVELVLPHGNTPYVILVDVIQKLMCFDDGGSVCEIHVKAGGPRTLWTPANEDAIIAAVIRKT
jgi:hypothetical protein